MIIESCNFVGEPTIDSAWRAVMLLAVRKGHDFVVKGGSYKGQVRKQLSHVTIRITQPGTRPLAPIMPPGISGSTSDDRIDEYFWEKILGNIKAENEQYTYGEFITKQVDRIVKLLVDAGGNTNQACIAIGDAGTTFLSDPPCLRVVSFKVVDGRLVMTVFFRSWDLYAGLPENLGGLQLLKEYVLSCLTEHMDVVDGEIIAYSDGLHIYEQYFDLVNRLNVDKIEVSPGVWEDKEAFQQVIAASGPEELG
jgi:thymidylate synthase